MRCDLENITTCENKVSSASNLNQISCRHILSQKGTGGVALDDKKMVRTRTSTSDIPVLTPNGWLCICVCIRGVGVVILVRVSMCMCTYANMHTVRYT